MSFSDEPLKIGAYTFNSRLLVGTSRYPNLQVMLDSLKASGAELVTVSIRRLNLAASQHTGLLELLREHNYALLPNTAGCYSAREAVTTAQMARELFDTKWIKLEVIGHADTLQPDPFGLVEAAAQLAEDGFEVFPYCTEDLVLCERLVEVGCKVLMPWGAPIGTGLGLNNIYGLRSLRAHFPGIPLVVDAGLGLPSHAAQAMEMGYDAVLLNTAVAKAGNPVAMARAFALAVEAGALAAGADPMDARDMAAPSTPVFGKAIL